MDLRALGETEPPTPSAEVAALIAGAPRPALRHPYRRAAARVALVAAAVLAGLVVAAANHGLPQPAQRVVSNFVNDLTPFEIGPDRQTTDPPPTPRTRHPEAPGGVQPSKSRPDEGPPGTDTPTEHRTDDGSSAPDEAGEDSGAEASASNEPTEGDLRTDGSSRRDEARSTQVSEPREGDEPREQGNR
jgi:hypothetical protein